ncbi:uncharacterized protein LOC6615110 [Drosophila sechellia]|uniref:GM23021 n=1 Tax=Drosophila sechellia TaxID=7238 RepID=B4I662_DROSE|nr:uncharacterized protein LOC6615110 [Drosophila sechellia]EDW56268.1 GM23021 [Drosophila sechellia]
MASDPANSRDQIDMDAHVSDISTSESELTSDVDTDSEGESSTLAASDTSLQASMYNLLYGESDSELEKEQENVCEETISLLAHEILCCEGDSDSEVETDGEDSDEARDYDMFGEAQECGLPTYRLMLSDEDVDNPNEVEVVGSNAIVGETIFLLEKDKDQQSEEKSESKKEEGLFFE